MGQDTDKKIEEMRDALKGVFSGVAPDGFHLGTISSGTDKSTSELVDALVDTIRSCPIGNPRAMPESVLIYFQSTPGEGYTILRFTSDTE